MFWAELIYVRCDKIVRKIVLKNEHSSSTGIQTNIFGMDIYK